MYLQRCGPFVGVCNLISLHSHWRWVPTKCPRMCACVCVELSALKYPFDGSYISFISVFFIFHHHDNPKSHPGGHVRKRDEVCRAFDWNGPWLFNYSCATMIVLKCSFWLYRNTHTYTHTFIYSYVHTFILLYLHTFVHSHIHTFVHSHIHTYTHTHIHTFTHTYTHTHIHTDTHTYAHKHIHTYIHTYIHTSIHACMHTFMHTYMDT